MSIISDDIEKAVDILNRGDVVAIPTETVYGLAGNIYNEEAIRKIFKVKGRPLFNPLIVHIHSFEQLNEIAEELPDKARLLANSFWPGSLTLILKKKSSIPDLITAGKDTVAVRIPDHPVTLDLLKRLSFPLAAPSANPFNRISPTKSSHVEDYFGQNIEMVLEGGDCKKGIESTIVGFENNDPVVYRLGSITIEDLENRIGKIQVRNKKEVAPDAPGMLEKHYAPRTRTILLEDSKIHAEDFSGQRIGLLKFTGESNFEGIEYFECLSITGDLEEAANKLYGALQKLDNMGLDIILVERFPNIGLGRSMNDRLERAAK